MLEQIQAILAIKLISWGDYVVTVGQVLLVPTFIVIGLLLTKWIANLVKAKLLARKVEPDVAHLVQRLFYVMAIIVLVITTLDLINVPLTAFAFVSGAVAIGVGFGAQNIINNFISGWILMWERPIRIGDFLEIDGEYRGSVEAINTRSTRIRRVDGVHLLIPNSKLLENTVINWTLVDKQIRTSVVVGVAYGSPAKLTAELMKQAAQKQDAVLSEPAVMVSFEDFGDNALIFEVIFWVNASVERDLRVIRSAIRFEIDEVFAQSKIVIAFPQRDVHIDGTLLLKHHNQDAQSGEEK